MLLERLPGSRRNTHHDRWLRQIEVREAMAQNPFTPTGLVLGLLPSIRCGLLAHLRDAGDAHPLASAAAAELIALRGGRAARVR